MGRFAKVLSDIAERLKKAGNSTIPARIAEYKAALKEEATLISKAERGPTRPGLAEGRERAESLDAFLKHILNEAAATTYAGVKAPPAMIVVALGGYGRMELNPVSDVDVTFIHGGGAKFPAGFELIVREVYEIISGCDFTLGHSTRSLSETIAEANKEMQSKTAMLESRLLWGSQKLFEKFQTRFEKECIRGKAAEYLKQRVEDQASRHAKYGETPYMQEPNIKNGCGGLRDYQNLLWMARVKYGVKTTAELVERKYLNESEQAEIEDAYEFLFHLRTELHVLTGRHTDIILTNQQLPLANRLGYEAEYPDILRRTEAFMRDYYRHARNIYELTELVSERLALPTAKPDKPRGLFRFLPFRKRKATDREVFDGFIATGDRITYENRQIFKADVSRMMRLFRHVQQRQLVMTPELRQLVRRRLKYVDSDFRFSRENSEVFAEILRQKGQVGPILRLMHRVDFLGRYVPEFGSLTALVQHEFFHRYAADEHTLVCIEKLDGLLDNEDSKFDGYRELFQKMEDSFLLYLALLLHDTGKAANVRSHSDVSAMNAQAVAKRFKLNAAQRQTLIFLVDCHDELAKTAQTQDLDDMATIEEFAGIVGTQSRLDALMLLTAADGQGVGDAKMWNDWKMSLMWNLYRQTTAFISDAAAYREQRAGQRQQLREEVGHLLSGNDWELEIDAHFQSMPDRYFLSERHTAQVIAHHIKLFRAFLKEHWIDDESILTPTIDWSARENAGHSDLEVVTWDRHQLLARICGSISAAGLSILSADIFTREDGLVLDTFRISTTRFEAITDRRDRVLVEKYLRESLKDETFDFLPLMKKALGRIGTSSLDFPTRIAIDSRSHPQFTVVEMVTPDRLGLLHDLLRAISDAGFEIGAARIATEKGAAVDTFYVGIRSQVEFAKETALEKPVSDDELTRLRDALVAAAAGKA
jgi:[protein-PII] uridylyltransferase